MRRLSLGVIACVLPLAGADPRVTEGLNVIRQRDLKADLTFLASDALEGRLSLRRGSEVAVQFIAAEFAKAGLTPAAGDSFLQNVPLVEYRTDAGATTLTVERGASRQVFHYPEDFSGGVPDDVTVRGEVVFAGYGITAPEYGYDDYAGLEARGKIVLVFEHEPAEDDPQSVFNGRGHTLHAYPYLKLMNAQKHGAAALLVAAEPNRRHPSARDRVRRVQGSAVRSVRLAPQALSESDEKIPLFTVSDGLAADLLTPTGRTPAEIQAAIDKDLRPRSSALAGTTVELRNVIAERRRGTSANVLGLLEGSDAKLRNETVVFSAHYDHDGDWDGRIHPGADDDGSGTVGVIELARAFARNPARPKRSIVFAVFAAEERGLLGSYYYAAHPARPLDSTRAVINFDMIGRNEAPSRQTDGLVEISSDTSNELGLIGTINTPEYRATVERANAEIGLRLTYKWDFDTGLDIFRRSDQFPFALHGIPAVWWFTGFHPDYHQVTDTVDRINFAKMERILKLAYLSGWAFAEQENPPRYRAVARPAAGR